MSTLPFDRSAAVALGIAATAMPFAASRDDEVERWLRILRGGGKASLILASLGVVETPREELDPPVMPPGDGGLESDCDAVCQVAGVARERAARRGAEAVDTTDILMALTEVYGDAFDHVLRAQGTSRRELSELLELQATPTG